MNNNQLIPYLTAHETADFDFIKQLFGSTPVVKKWRYYYGYNDALRTIDLAYSPNIYDDWVLFIPPGATRLADKLARKHPEIFNHYATVEKLFFSGLKPEHLKQALASQQMVGVSLELAKEVLTEANIEFNEEEIIYLKAELLKKNSTYLSKNSWMILTLGIVIIAILVLIFVL